MDKRDYLRLAVAESASCNGGAVLSVNETHSAVSEPPTAVEVPEELKALPYPTIQASEEAIRTNEAGSVARGLISPVALKKRRQAARPRWRNN